MAVRSKALCRGTATTSASGDIYTVPAGKRTIVRTANVVNLNAAGTRIAFTIWHGGSPDTDFTFFLAPHGGVGEDAHVYIWIVLEEGDSLRVQASANSVEYVLSGAELEL